MVIKFLQAKHWQLFVLGIVVPFVLYFFIMFSMVFTGFEMAVEQESNPLVLFAEMSNAIRLMPLVVLLSFGVLCSWFWSIGNGLQPSINEVHQLNTKWFRISIIFVFTYMILLSFFMIFFTSSFFTRIAEFDGKELNVIHDNFRLYFYIVALIFPLHLLAVGCSFYNIYFVAKTLKTVELQREVQFSDYLGEFFMFWFYPIGVWIVQPKINKWIEDA